MIDAVGRVLLGKEHQVRLAFSCLLAGGHLLIEDRPGMGKSTLAEALARAFALAFKRVSFTSDLLPADLTGLNVFNPAEASFRFQPGPLFTQVLLADEINRASPRTQSALLEAMAAGRVSVDGVSHALPDPFFVIATQNSLDQVGTSPLPEAQLDRFLMRLSLGFPDRATERTMLTSGFDSAFDRSPPRLGPEALQQLQQRLHGRWGRVASQGINSAHPLNWAGLLQQRQQQWHRPRIAVLTEHLQTLQPLIVTLLEQDQPPITSPGRLERVFLSVIDGDCIQGVTVQLRSQFPGQQLRIKRQACKALIP